MGERVLLTVGLERTSELTNGHSIRLRGSNPHPCLYANRTDRASLPMCQTCLRKSSHSSPPQGLRDDAHSRLQETRKAETLQGTRSTIQAFPQDRHL